METVIQSSSSKQLEEKMKIMKEKFARLQLADDEIVDSSVRYTHTPTLEDVIDSIRSPIHLEEPAPSTQASKRWDRIRKSIVTSHIDSHSPQINSIVPDIDFDEEEVSNFWLDASVPSPDITAFPEDVILQIDTNDYEPYFERESEPIGLTIKSVPESVITEKRNELEAALFAEKVAMVNDLKSKEVDVMWREHLARVRVMKMEEEAKERLNLEKEKLSQTLIERERQLGREFRRAREDLEAAVQKQNAIVRERFGEVIMNQEVRWRGVEFSSN